MGNKKQEAVLTLSVRHWSLTGIAMVWLLGLPPLLGPQPPDSGNFPGAGTLVTDLKGFLPLLTEASGVHLSLLGVSVSLLC